MDIIKSIIVWLIGTCYVLVTFPLTLITLLLALPFDRERIIIHMFLMYQSKFFLYLIPIWKIRAEGRERAIKGNTYVIISNHQSILDILLMNSLKYQYKWISKIENFNVPVIGWYLKMARYITVDRGNDESKTEMLEKSFQLALQANVSILPVLIDGILPKHGMIFGSGHHIRIKVLDPIDPKDFGTDNPENLALKLSSLMTSALKELRDEINLR
jgi:1-acyl-sn-glycerol-3-phosphate acyltransferase